MEELVNSTEQTAPLNVLIIEQDPISVIRIRKLLGEEGRHYKIRHIRDGLEAFDYFISTDTINNPRPDLIVLDEDLPKLSGHQLLDTLRANGHLNNIPIILVQKNKSSADSTIKYRLMANEALTHKQNVVLSPFLYVIQNYFKNNP
jgi:CheY-like chemotaxis protein